MTEAAKLARALADAFPRVRRSTNTKRNWVYEGHAALAEAMPDLVPPPRKYKEGVRSGVWVDGSHRDGLQFLQMPFLSDVAYMLASDMPDRVHRAGACVDEAQRHMGGGLLARFLELSFHALRDPRSLVVPPEEMKTTVMALLAAFVTASAFAKMWLASRDGRVLCSWGAESCYDFVLERDGTHPPSMELLHDLCALQLSAEMSFLATTGSVEPRAGWAPAAIVERETVLATEWGAGWLVWQLLEMVRRYGPPVCRSRDDVFEKMSLLFPMSLHVSERLAGAVLEGMPDVGASADIREEVLRERRYSLWPGVTDVIWEEGGLERLTLLSTAPAGLVFAMLRGRADLSDVYVDWGEEKDVPVQLFVEIPALDDDRDWAVLREQASEGLDDLALPMEAIRMCCVPVERKARAGRVPAGYVQSPKGRRPKGEAPAVRVTYIPRVHHRAPEGREGDGEGGSTGTGRTHALHQVAGFLRQLPIGWRASDAARARAEASGISPPLTVRRGCARTPVAAAARQGRRASPAGR